LWKKLEAIPGDSLAYLDTPRLEAADRIISSIDAIRREHKFGFLPDNQHWRALSSLVEQNKFVLAVMSGQLQASYLALTDAKELEKYVTTLRSPVA
jgi:N-acyl-D-aspartate/D-glutamate deacylase